MIQTTTRPVRRWFHRRTSGRVSVDIGTASIKVAKIGQSLQGWQVSASRIVPHREPLNVNDLEGSLRQIEETLQRAWAPSGRWFSDSACCLLPTCFLECRSLELQAGTDAEMRQAVADDLTQDGGQEELWSYGHWRCAEPSQPGKPGLVGVVATGTKLAERLAMLLARRGLDCQSMECGLLVLPEAVALMERDPAATGLVAAVDWGFSGARLVIANDGQAGYWRELRDCGLSNLLKGIADGLGLQIQECARLLGKYSVMRGVEQTDGSELERNLTDLAAPHVQRFIDELRRTLAHIGQQFPDQKPGRIVMFGGGAALLHIGETVQSATGLPTSVFALDRRRYRTASFDPAPVIGVAIASACGETMR